MTPHPGQLHPAQRFDRDAVKAMLVDALATALPLYLEANGQDSFTLTPLARLDMDDVDVDHLTKTVLEWFGGKGAA